MNFMKNQAYLIESHQKGTFIILKNTSIILWLYGRNSSYRAVDTNFQFYSIFTYFYPIFFEKSSQRPPFLKGVLGPFSGKSEKLQKKV